jgi:hypothetical protein
MLDKMRVNDEQLDESDIRQLENADEIVHFFARLRYDVDERTISRITLCWAWAVRTCVSISEKLN